MKKIFLNLFVLGALVANAQDEAVSAEGGSSEISFETKKGNELHPQAGDIGIGISATAPLTYFGNVIAGGANGNGQFASVNQNGNFITSGTTVFGKYMLSSNTAVRARISSQTNRNVTMSALIADDGDPFKEVQDKRSVISRGLTVGAGIEKRRGYHRLIGVYGAEAILGFNQSNVTSYEYSNEISAANQTPTDGFGGNNDEIAVDGIANNRTLKKGGNSGTGIGALAFIGVEYFFAPRISLGGEFSWGMFYRPNNSTYTTVEFYNPNTNAVEEYTESFKNGRQFISGTNTLGGNVNLMFYF